uniref:Uncharacterized protein n=1 Tax=Physcomitrium patens TaxID=3218 RepID=A0A2K1JJ49_PHYPA|nr:hypothetical protein PHYPA_018971 [Physcomitrium patens]
MSVSQDGTVPRLEPDTRRKSDAANKLKPSNQRVLPRKITEPRCYIESANIQTPSQLDPALPFPLHAHS